VGAVGRSVVDDNYLLAVDVLSQRAVDCLRESGFVVIGRNYCRDPNHGPQFGPSPTGRGVAMIALPDAVREKRTSGTYRRRRCIM
jgi:hypothetical protein